MRVASASYLESVLMKPNGLIKTTQRVVKIIRKHNLDFDAIAFTGMSGSLVAPAVAIRLRKQPLIVRTEGDSSHSGRFVDGGGDVHDYIIVDDFISTGKTIRFVIDRMDNLGLDPSHCKGVFLYTGCDGTITHSIGKKQYCIPCHGCRECDLARPTTL